MGEATGERLKFFARGPGESARAIGMLVLDDLLDAAVAWRVGIRRLELDEADHAHDPGTARYGDECEAKLIEIEAELWQINGQLMRDAEERFVDINED